MSIPCQLKSGKEQLLSKRPVRSYVAYFQAFTNTYAPVEYLEKIFAEAISDPDVKILSIATRADCLGDDVLALLDRLNRIKPVWVELGLQTIHEDTARFIRRGYSLDVFDSAVENLRRIGIETIVHVILFLPGETESEMLETVRYLNSSHIQGIKLQLLHVLKGTDLASFYEAHPFHVPDMENISVCWGAASLFLIRRLSFTGSQETDQRIFSLRRFGQEPSGPYSTG